MLRISKASQYLKVAAIAIPIQVLTAVYNNGQGMFCCCAGLFQIRILQLSNIV